MSIRSAISEREFSPERREIIDTRSIESILERIEGRLGTIENMIELTEGRLEEIETINWNVERTLGGLERAVEEIAHKLVRLQD